MSSTSSNPAFAPVAAGPARSAAAPPAGRRVTDAPTRMFHWLFALSFAGAYLSAEGERWRAMHVTLGYTMAGLLVFRVLYGLFGPRHASLGLMWRKLGSAPAWVRSLANHSALRTIDWRQGQNLAMALAVVALLALALPLSLSGYAVYDDWSDLIGGGEWLEDLHEFFGNTVLIVVLAHLALIAGVSLLRRRNLAAPMLTGRVAGPGPDLVRQPRKGVAALMLLVVLAFGAWQWQQSPNGLVPISAWSAAAEHGQADD
jgi:cytochrome b